MMVTSIQIVQKKYRLSNPYNGMIMFPFNNMVI